MNYKAIHDRIILRSQNRLLEGYSELHHIVPKCLGGSDDTPNLVELTRKEHVLVHVLLSKIYPDHSGILYAARMMSNMRDITTPRSGIPHTNATKEKLRQISTGHKHSQETKDKMSKAERPPPWHKGLTLSDEHKKAISETLKGRPTWSKGKKLSEETRRKMSISQQIRRTKKIPAEAGI